MPSADDRDFIPGFDDFNEPRPPVEEETAWAAPAPSPRKIKKRKGRKYADAQFKAAEEEDTPYAKSITPSPPAAASHGVNLPASPTKDEPLATEEPPLVADIEDDTTAVEDVEPTPLPKPSPAPSPTLRSPRPAVAKPTANSFSPPIRPAGLFRPPSGYEGYPKLPSQPQQRRGSTHTSPRPAFVEPAGPPHMAQPHFYGLPDLGLNFGSKKEQNGGKAAGSDGYCCCFDSFADSGDMASSRQARDALLVGSEGGLEVFRVLPNKFEVVGRLEGLRGSVVGAKVLPHVDRHDEVQTLRPLVAVVVHGALVGDARASGSKDDAFYQTTVEVYSLQTQEHVATLYKSVPVALEQPTIGHLSSLPGPVGDLSISARGRFVLLASGKSGELFIFSHATTSTNNGPRFRCLGKYWTSLQVPLDAQSSRPPSSSDGIQPTDEASERTGVPLFSLSHRWLALVSPPLSSHISIQGSPLLSEHNPNPPGLGSHVAPPQPPITCDVAGADAEGTWSRITRQAAQGVVKYSQRGIEMGWQGWRELTYPTPQAGQQQHGRTSSKEHEHMFPPTNAPPDDAKRLTKEPAVVSIIDLENLLEAEELKPKYSPPPLTTFALSDGCNFLSLSSGGLRLLTVSRKGEISTIWDLTQSCHGTTRRSSHVTGESEVLGQGPCVKQIHCIARSSQSVVVDSAWSRDDDCLALLTAHGTVHLHEVPSRPPRKRKRRSTSSAQPLPEKAQATVSVSQGLSPPSANGGFLGSLKSGWQQVSTQVNTIRSQNPVSALGLPTSFAGFREATATAGHAGGRALAKGLSQGYSAAKGGASDYWHADDNKIRHKALQEQCGPGALRWLKRQSGMSLAIVCGGTVHLHPVQRITRRKGDVMVSGLKHDRYGRKHFALPAIRTSSGVVSAVKKADDCAAEGPHGFWSLHLSPGDLGRRVSGEGGSPLSPSQPNEVETNPPYCPFHVDSRVSIFTYDDTTVGSQRNLLEPPDEAPRFLVQGHLYDDIEEEAWLFGETLPPSSKVNTHDDHLHEFHGQVVDSDDDIAGVTSQVESRLTVHAAADDDGGEQININMRRARNRNGGGGFGRAEEDFGMYEDEDVDDASLM